MHDDMGRRARRIVDRWTLIGMLTALGLTAIFTEWGWAGIFTMTIIGTLVGVFVGWIVAGLMLRRYDRWMRSI